MLVILDEPTTALDAFQEAELYARFMEFTEDYEDYATVIVSHRLPIARLADRVIVLDSGRLIEQGSHTQLMANATGVYRKMFQAQSEIYHKRIT